MVGNIFEPVKLAEMLSRISRCSQRTCAKRWLYQCVVGGPSALLAQQPAVLPSPSGKGQPRRGYPPASVHSAATAPTFPTAQPHCWLLPPASR
ncbi:hypothetical protein HPB47_017628 [Ixodes persulcatus]|uniref:Uncharacterized protein n=1 Tax=Ixodes persulcatus TaxID=34615 RepID=A0AC60QMT7_IXOPE|nr:hypothetical protein HPB47_017628 [Ixodes persulcatus]